ncbi:ImmA/IrrE family metallo-endopeptidase [Bifidobacterium scaligerum]|uniref:IrrE N-terminal-like domain-containing protein n=1 Tax=Bifidobacterium scaligerum TaxID=2052656 RepID=A0A2M9HT43_9BIFI|nr:ImmA/IrrE family metallo-endopeptidase [Bifidobacterium scaligerum]PJM79969.1 hypothetical protein CUU80_02210 [Bifidobacterium scaligerum]
MIPLPVDAHLNYGPMRMSLYTLAPGLTVMSEVFRDDLQGVYSRSQDTILIDRSMTYTRKRCTLVHELVHRMYQDEGHEREHRCRLMTARLLISPTEYALAERIYEGERFQMAEELNVTPEVIDDYREYLHDSGMLL